MSSQARRTRGEAEVGLKLPPKMTPLRSPRRSGWPASGSASVRPGRAALSARWTNVRLQGKGLLLGLRSPLALLMKLDVALGPAGPERLTAKSFARWANEPSSRSKPSVRPAASAPTSATSGRIEATLARFVRRGRDRRLPQHVWVLFLRALAQPIDAQPRPSVWRWRLIAQRRHHSGPARLCRSQERDHQPGRLVHFVGRRICGQRIRCGGRTVLRRRFDFFTEIRRVDCFPLGAIFLRSPCSEIWPRQRRAQAHAFSKANAIKLALRTTRGERRGGGDERRDDQRRPHEGKPIPNSKRDGSMPTLMQRLLQRLGCCSGAAPHGPRRSPLSLALSCTPPPSHRPLRRRRGDHKK
jgi:hypothetical protein